MANQCEYESKLLGELCLNAPHFEFYQALRLCDRFASGYKTKLIANDKLNFPSADIAACRVENNIFEFEFNFMGLCGVDSPLPQYFFANAAIENAKVTTDFLCMLNQRIYGHLYQAWVKYKIPVQLEFKSKQFLNYLIALSGNVLNQLNDVEFSFCGLLGMHSHNPSTLISILESVFKIKVSIVTYCPHWIKTDTESNLGNVLSLGENAIVGAKVLDVTSKIKIIIGPVTFDQLSNLLPNTLAGNKLIKIITSYLPYTLTFDLIFIILTPNASLILGGDDIILGIWCWIGNAYNQEYRVNFLMSCFC